MMHEVEKSDLSEVAEAGERLRTSVGESVERREGTKGNTSKHGTRWKLSQERVLPGLDRVRERAKSERKEQFTALLHQSMSICFDRLSPGSGERRPQEWTDGPGSSISRTWMPTLRTCIRALIAVPIGHCPRGGPIFRKEMGSGRWGCGAGRQDRPARRGGRTQCGIRGRLPGVQLRVSP